jgi:hypothetical protein
MSDKAGDELDLFLSEDGTQQGVFCPEICEDGMQVYWVRPVGVDFEPFKGVWQNGYFIPAEEYEEPEPVMLYVGGSKVAFRCDCGANVFTRLPDGAYRCNGCLTAYHGERG